MVISLCSLRLRMLMPPLNSLCPISQSAGMFAKFQNAFDKVGLFLQDGGRSIGFRRRMSMSKRGSKVQSIFDLCKTTFTPSASPTPSLHNIQKLCSLLDAVGPSDVGLKEENSEDDDRGYGLFGLNNLNRVARWAQPITYLDIYECPGFTMCIFCFPSSSVIPLHDHPTMTVFSKVLYGSLHVKAYDWVEPACFSKSKTSGYKPRLAKLAADKVLTCSSGTSVLYPNAGGNLHCFTAITPCAVLDILSPPYREDAGRKCTYYHDYPYSTFGSGNGADLVVGKEEDHAWLMEITAADLYMRQGLYSGPAIQV